MQRHLVMTRTTSLLGAAVVAAMASTASAQTADSHEAPAAGGHGEAGEEDKTALELTLMGVSSIYQVLVTGILVILAVATDQLSRKGARG